jgi:molybdopterin synthase catalytic subunit
MTAPFFAAVTENPIDVDQLRSSASQPETGAIVVFCGDVRNHDGGRTVLKLDYEAHPTAGDVLTRCAETIANKADVQYVSMSHRYGSLAIGDTALAVVIAAAHRETAFTVCAEAVDLVKAELPMWKHQFFADGTDEWVNSA